MKFRDPKTGEVFDVEREGATGGFCAHIDCCSNCPLPECAKVEDCSDWINAHPAEAALRMGFEVVEDHIGEATEKVRPRICEVLGVEEFERICEAVHNGWWDEKKRQGVTDHPDMIPYGELAEDVKEYDRVTVRRVLDALGVRYESKPRFTEEEVADAKVLIRALRATGLKRNRYEDIYATSDTTADTLLDSEMFPSLRPGQAVNLQEILKENEK